MLFKLKKKRKNLNDFEKWVFPLFASFHFITTFTALILFKGMQSYSKSEWQRVGMYAKCQLLSKPFFFQLKRKMLLIRRLSNLQSKGFAVVCNEWDSLLLHKDMTKIHPKLVYFCHHEPSFNPINTFQFKDFFLIFISIIQTLAILTLKWIWAKTAAVRSFL